MGSVDNGPAPPVVPLTAPPFGSSAPSPSFLLSPPLPRLDYRPDINSSSSPIYRNYRPSYSTGTITYTFIISESAEGYFNVKGYYQNDSVIIVGTSKCRIETVR